MHYAFVSATSEGGEWTVASAGTTPNLGAMPCELAVSLVPDASSQALAANHRSAPIQNEQLDADIIIAASRTERAELARLSPSVRPRLFTLSEAVLLGRHLQMHQPLESAGVNTVRGVAELLDSQRGVIVIPRPARQRQVLRGRPDRSPLDVPDVHMKGHHAHLRMLKRVLAESTELASQLGRLPSLGAPSEKRDRLGLV